MRHVYLLANLRRHDLAEQLARSVRRYLERREDVHVHPRIFVRLRDTLSWRLAGERGDERSRPKRPLTPF